MSVHFFLLALVLMVVAPVKAQVNWCGLRPDSDIVLIQKTYNVGPWKVTFGDCVFTGNTDGSPLLRKGSCPDQVGSLDLSERNITVVPVAAFQGMGNMT
jgi:hypothetical protein